MPAYKRPLDGAYGNGVWGAHRAAFVTRNQNSAASGTTSRPCRASTACCAAVLGPGKPLDCLPPDACARGHPQRLLAELREDSGQARHRRALRRTTLAAGG